MVEKLTSVLLADNLLCRCTFNYFKNTSETMVADGYQSVSNWHLLLMFTSIFVLNTESVVIATAPELLKFIEPPSQSIWNKRTYVNNPQSNQRIDLQKLLIKIYPKENENENRRNDFWRRIKVDGLPEKRNDDIWSSSRPLVRLG